MPISKPLYVYLQRPDTGAWLTVGRYLHNSERRHGQFRYAPSYQSAGLSWSIDPVNLPFLPDTDMVAPRYHGLHDVLRDACPDAWGKLLIQREHGVAPNSHDSRYLYFANNADRWGALAVGTTRQPSVSMLACPRLPRLDALAEELLALYERRPPQDAALRKRLVATPSLGGARPKATVRDGARFWLVKPHLPSDTVDIPLLEHFTQQWGSACGLDFAETVHQQSGHGLSVLRSLRFDRHGERRLMAISGASLLQTEYPGSGDENTRWSYPRLSEELKRIGAPPADQRELFRRMVFNAVAGNDDDHPRNHAAVYRADERRWRLAPAFDVVPNPDQTPRVLALQLSLGRYDISRDAIIGDALRFGFSTHSEAAGDLDGLLQKMHASFNESAQILSISLRTMLRQRLSLQLKTLA